MDLGDQNDQNCHQHLKAFTNTFVFNICHQYQCNIWWWCQFSDFGDGILILMTFQCKKSFTDISKSEKICHHYSILSPMILMSHWQELCHSNTPCTYNVVQNINKIIHSDLVFVFLKVRKKFVELNFYSSDYFAYFSSGEVRRFFICSDLEVCLLDRGDWLFLWRTLTVYNFWFW